MHDPWTDRLSDYIDGVLDAAAERDVRQHLEACADCRAIEAELRAVVAAAQMAPDVPPKRDLWTGIQAGITAGPRTAPESTTPPDSATHDLARHRAARRVRRLSFSVPQLAAAAVVLMTISGGAVWLLLNATGPAVASGVIVQSSGSADRSVRMVDTRPAPQYTADIAALEAALDEARSELDPATVEVIERSLESIDVAIAAARAALDADPGNPYLHRQLDNTMRKKVDILRLATRVQRGGS